MKDIVIRQGDARTVEIPIVINGESVHDSEEISEIEIYLGELRKTLTSEAITFDSENSCAIFPLSQTETFNFVDGLILKFQVRVKLNSQEEIVQSFDGPKVYVLPARSRTVL